MNYIPNLIRLGVLPILGAWLGCNSIIGLEVGEPEEVGSGGSGPSTGATSAGTGATSAGTGGGATTTGTSSGTPGVCAPGETRCDSDGQQTCDASGQWGTAELCRLGCNGEVCVLVAGMSLGNSHTCAALTDGTVRCWGSSESGQLGDGTLGDGSFRANPAPVVGLNGVTQVAAGNEHNCARLVDGTVKCWGHNGFGKLGDGTYTNSPIPAEALGLASAAGVTLGHSHSCAWLADGSAKCWGINQFGQLGTGTTNNASFTPVSVVGLSTAEAMSAGDRHTCALLQGGTVKCWGDGYSGQLGDGTSGAGAQKLSPSAVPNVAGVAQIALGFYSACVRFTSGAVSCWGSNLYGQVGDGTTQDRPSVTQVDSLAGVALLGSGQVHTCALRNDSATFCWGRGSSGELGAGLTPTGQSEPAPVLNKSGAVGIAGGGEHTCAWYPDATVQCWGNNDFGQLGDGTSGGSKSLPTEVTW